MTFDATRRRSPARTDLYVRQRSTANDPPALPMQTRELPVGAIDTKKRTVKVTFTTGAAVKRRRWAGWDTSVPFEEILEVSRSAINLDRLNAGAPALDSHSAYSTSTQVGVVERAWIEGGEGRALIRFPSEGVDENADRMFALVSEGIIRNVSVGYAVDEVRVVEPQKKGEIEKRIITRWTPFEVSFVTIPADAGAQVRGAEETFPVIINRANPNSQKGISMPTNNVTDSHESDHDSLAERSETSQVGLLSRRALAAERARAAEINTLATRHAMPVEFATRHIADGTPLDQVRALVLDAAAERAAATIVTTRTSYGDSTFDNPDFVARAYGDAIYARMSGTKPEGAAAEVMGMSLVEMGASLRERSGIRVNRRNRDELVRQIMTRSGDQTTSDFPNLLVASGHRVLNQAYQVAQSPLLQLCKRRDAADFRPLTSIKLSEAPQLLKVAEGGEIKHGARSESAESFKIDTYARIFSITRKAIINDDLNAFADSAAAFGRAAANTEANLLVSLLTANSGNGGNLADGVSLYNAAHNNLAAAGTTINVTALSDGRVAMRSQKDIDGKTLISVTPKYLVVGAAKETEAQQFLHTIAAVTAATVNPFSGQLQLLVDPRLSGLGWRLFCDPAEVACIVMAHLAGADGVYIEERLGFEVDGIEIKARLDVGFGLNDFRGTYLNPGA